MSKPGLNVYCYQEADICLAVSSHDLTLPRREPPEAQSIIMTTDTNQSANMFHSTYVGSVTNSIQRFKLWLPDNCCNGALMCFFLAHGVCPMFTTDVCWDGSSCLKMMVMVTNYICPRLATVVCHQSKYLTGDPLCM